MEDRRTGIGEAAGHLRAELLLAEDRFRRGEIDEAAYLARIRVIGKRRRAFSIMWAPNRQQPQFAADRR
jgi:hypothetical protein